MPTASMKLAVRMQDLAESIRTVLKDITGEDLAFVLIVSADKIAQYVSNASRPDATTLIEELLARWKAGRADIPATYNPDLKE